MALQTGSDNFTRPHNGTSPSPFNVCIIRLPPAPALEVTSIKRFSSHQAVVPHTETAAPRCGMAFLCFPLTHHDDDGRPLRITSCTSKDDTSRTRWTITTSISKDNHPTTTGRKQSLRGPRG